MGSCDKESWHTSNPNFVYHRMVPRKYSGMPELAPFCWDLRHPFNAIVATTHRFARDMPTPIGSSAADYLAFVDSFLSRFESCAPGTIPTTMEWLDRTNYGGPRKSELLGLARSTTHVESRHLRCNSFIKLETYPSASKLPRGINSYSDESKALLGPLFHAVDKKFFSHRFFVKGSNPRAWPQRLKELYGDSKVISTDFTSFESHHQHHFAQAVHKWFRHMTNSWTLTR